MLRWMGSRLKAVDEARRRARQLRAQLGSEIRMARIGAGLSQASAGAGAGMSHAQWSRIERGVLDGLTIDQACRAGAAVGLQLSVRAYPDGDPVRDAAQLALLERFHARLPDRCRWWTEALLPIPGDRRAWDALIELSGRRAGCEAETRLSDVQALERRLALKLRDGGVDLLLLLVADTANNRRVLDGHREALRGLLPLDGRQVLGSLRAGRLPEANGLVIL
jgi:transcriptional regulator with XRE-family HTH domain